MNNINFKENKEILQLLFLFFLSVISVYYVSPILNQIFFLFILIGFSFSKKNYFWFVFFLIIVAHPFRFFEGASAEQIHRIPEFNIVGKYGLLFQELFLIILFIKAKFAKSKPILIYRKEYLPVLWLLLFLILSSFYYGIQIQSFIFYFRGLLYFSLFYSVPKLINSEDFPFLIKIFIIFTFAILVSQIVFILSGFNFTDFVTGSNWTEIFQSEGYIRAYDSVFAQFFTFVFGLAFLSMKTPPISRRLIYNSLLAAYLSIFLTGTRGWMIAFSIGAIFYIYFILKNKSKIINFGVIALVLFMSLLILKPESLNIFTGGIERIGTLGNLAEGDATAGGTLGRLTIRLPRVLVGISENPIFGWGFSKKFAMFDDGHVGWANQVLQMGLLGLFIFMNFWVRFWMKNRKISLSLSRENNFKQSIFTLNSGLIILLAIHSTSRTMFNFSMGFSMITLVIMYFLFSELWVNAAISEEERK